MKKLILFLLLAIATLQASAQCTFRNTAFKSGEFISYNLYFNWKFVWVKAGTASMSTVATTYHGKSAYRTSLITRGSSKADKFFLMRDTLLCYNTQKMEPLYYRKGVREGKRYTVDQVWYSYPGGKCHIKQCRQHSNGQKTWNQETFSYCVYDMMSIYMRARSFVPTKWKNGQLIDFPIADGKKTYAARLRYEGKMTVKADNGVKYRCLKLAYMDKDNDSNKYKKIVDFFVTDDENHLPIRLDMHLKFGYAKAFLTQMKGVRNSITSVVK